jgi:hypothetical protein
MANRLFVLLVVVVLLGCTHEPAVPGPEPSPQPVASPETDPSKGSPEAEGGFTHELTVDTAYYSGGPQQARPPDGTLKAGIKVEVIEDAGSYCRVRSEDGTEAYVDVGSLREIE